MVMNSVKSCREAVVPAGMGLLLLMACSSQAQYTNGIYAEFNTSMGSYTCRLDYVLAPKTCANFIGLATGQRPWLDLPSGTVKTNPFYDGTTFHRVIAGFMNQGGSRNGLGTDSPGYQFEDEFTPLLRHDGFGVLSMANSGPDSNGSQHFITVSPQPSLDDVHSVFGRLQGGSNVVYAINNVVTSNEKPETNVVLNSVVIRRVGGDAEAFGLHTNGLPLVTNLALQIRRTDTNISLSLTHQVDCNFRLYRSQNLSGWTALNFGYQTISSQMATVMTSGALPREFYRAVQVQYPQSLHVPRNVLGKTLTLTIGAGNVITLNFDLVGGGTYTGSIGDSGNLLPYSWVQDPYRGRIVYLVYSGMTAPMALHFDFDTSTSGTVKGKAYPYFPLLINPLPIAGTFTSN
jgi:peptidyl-prolyl cis-trans isomerase A (cyclophilin A)